MALRIGLSIVESLTQYARSALPNECCGILVGRRSGADTHVEHIVPAENIADGDRRNNYQIDWETLFATVRRLRSDPCEMIGFYHSHPDGSDTPSVRDAAQAWVDHSYMIIPVADSGVLELTSWRIPTKGAAFEPEAIVVT